MKSKRIILKFYSKIALVIQERFRMAFQTAKEFYIVQMEIFLMDNFQEVYFMEKVSTNIPMDPYTKEIFKKEQKMGTEKKYIRIWRHLKACLKTTKKSKVYIRTKTKQFMKEDFLLIEKWV